ncbi:PDDEXK nuclease domain-containing protein [Parapedobacter soli]|uniref:PDDEXK nuclease domain-containing protein n=1 Tax=Parapedobacter soli TaxID=416955 RepID=UPI0021C5D063|nr:PDDEXK nuclease domain-containing protein [Parapedobacter soli]
MDKRFIDIIQLIQQSRSNAIRAVNTELINLYWNVGVYVKQKLSVAEWGDKTVNELADFIQKNNPELKGFSRAGLYRMVQFYETYTQTKFVAPLVRQIQNTDSQKNKIVSPAVRQFQPQDIKNTLLAELSWTHHLTIFSRCKTEEEREFYLRMAIKEKYTKRELDRQISASLFERVMLGNAKLSSSPRELNTDITNPFKDSYVFEFLNLPDPHSESDLQKGLIKQMKNFILELGSDFIFIDEQYKVQVGNRDFYIDLLFYHRDLQCLIAFELKADEFQPEHLGQLNFYLEALDRNAKKKHENPSIGILLCKGKENEVVEFALSRSLSPAMVAEYQTQLPNKKLLQQKLHEIFENSNTENI